MLKREATTISLKFLEPPVEVRNFDGTVLY